MIFTRSCPLVSVGKGEWQRLGKIRGMRNNLGHHRMDERQVFVSDWVVGVKHGVFGDCARGRDLFQNKCET